MIFNIILISYLLFIRADSNSPRQVHIHFNCGSGWKELYIGPALILPSAAQICSHMGYMISFRIFAIDLDHTKGQGKDQCNAHFDHQHTALFIANIYEITYGLSIDRFKS